MNRSEFNDLLPEAERAIADRERRSFEPSGLQVAQHCEPALAALPVAVLHGHELLASVPAYPD